MESEQEIRIMHMPLSNPDLHFPDLSIEGFRGFRQLSIPQLGRVNLITGKNHTGKSSILEALHIHTQHANPTTINQILGSREEFVRDMNEDSHVLDAELGFPIASLFHGFPRLVEDFDPIIIATNGQSQPLVLKLEIELVEVSVNGEEPRGSDLTKEDFWGELETAPYLVVNTEKQAVRFRWSLERLHSLRTRFSSGSVKERMPCTVVSAGGGQGTYRLGTLWDDAIMRGDEEEVVRALQIIEPNITSVWMIGDRLRSRKAMVRTKIFTPIVPLRSMGDGLNRLFTIILSLLDAQGGILLIDEFENGIHHTVQLDVWRIIFELAQRYDIQVFATTHSRDAVEMFQKAAADSPAMGMLLHLFRRESDIYASVFAESELAVATRHQVEMR